MDKKRYIFLWLLSLLLMLSYLNIKHQYRNYIREKYYTEERVVIDWLSYYINTEAPKLISYYKSPAIKNKILKNDYQLKSKWEIVIKFTKEQIYNKFKTLQTPKKEAPQLTNEQTSITKWMTNFQKWVFFLINKDLR
jgi:hypothetical protein